MSETRIALVTGASRGIGQAIARELGASGLHVVGTATSSEGAARIEADLQQHCGRGSGRVLNVTDPDSVQALMDSLKSEAGEPAVLVNNAGITRDNLLMRMKDAEWDEIIATNLTSVYRLSQACLRAMMKARWGRIVSIASVVGVMGNAGQSNYAAAKAGIIGFSKSLAREVGSRGVTVNVVAPGFIATDMTDALNEAQRSAILSQVALGRLGSAQEVAQAVAFLASDAAGYITGETLHVNGGLYMI